MCCVAISIIVYTSDWRSRLGMKKQFKKYMWGNKKTNYAIVFEKRQLIKLWWGKYPIELKADLELCILILSCQPAIFQF